ncbi:tRNA 2-thiouridine(34) synthase MnmA, partial [bacterium]|nr:tRNA 2-thiouridine(34) synthase MnmA [bacterium]
YTKEQVRAMALTAGLPAATRKDSQDICFMHNSVGIGELLGWHTGHEPEPGKIVDEDGGCLGEHPGVEYFTVGQRKGLRRGGGTEGLVVHRLEPATNTVVVAQREAHPVAALTLRDFTDMAPGLWQPRGPVMARTRYRQPLWKGQVYIENGAVRVEPEDEQFGMSRGQWCVGYRNDTVLFGGIIDGIEYR